MGESAVDPEIIKRTQDTLGQIISAPALTDKLLNRPPVQFLQDIVKAIIKKTNFLQGLYSDDELTSAYLKEGRENKTLFMKKLVTAVSIAVKRPPEVRVSKILSGQEADKTNLLLQALADAINSNVDSSEVVRKTLQTVGGGDANENEDQPQSRENKEQEQPEKRRSKEERSTKSREREEPSTEKKSSRDVPKDQTDGDVTGHSKQKRSSRTNEDASDERKPVQKQDDDDDNERKDESEPKSRRSTRPSSAKGPRKQQNNDTQQRPPSPKADPPPSRQPPPSASIDRDNVDERHLVRPGTANTAAKSRKPMKTSTSDDLPGSTGRIPSAAQRGQGTLIVESKDSRDNNMNNGNDDDDDDNFLIQEEKPSATKSFKVDDTDVRNGGMGDQDDDDGDQHGALLKKMIDSKKQLEHGSEIAGQRTDVKTIAQNDAHRRREREKIQKDVDKLRETIQSLTKSVVPLGKILEYLQEDYETMAKEMQTYSDEYKRTVVELRKEKFTTDQNLEPLRAALLDFDDQIVDMKNRIIFMKKKINNNEKLNAAHLLDIIRKAK